MTLQFCEWFSIGADKYYIAPQTKTVWCKRASGAYLVSSLKWYYVSPSEVPKEKKKEEPAEGESKKPTPKREEPMKNFFDSTLEAGLKGVEQGLVNEASDTLMQLGTTIFKDYCPELLQTEQGKELAKGVAAIAVLLTAENIDIPKKKKVQKYSALQVQTSTMLLLKPHLTPIREAVVALTKLEK